MLIMIILFDVIVVVVVVVVLLPMQGEFGWEIDNDVVNALVLTIAAHVLAFFPSLLNCCSTTIAINSAYPRQ